MHLDRMNTPLVTIGIPCYNVGRFIALSIKSVLMQTYTNLELIITDDGSTDNTVDEIRKFNDSRIKLIVDGENHGISYRLNQQIDMAKGDIFIRMDGDDIMFPNRIEEQVKYLQEHPTVDVVGTGAVIIDDENTIIGLRQGEISVKNPEDAINNSVFIHPTVAGKLSFFKKYKYDESLCGVEDKDLWCRGLQDSIFDIMPKPLLFYRDPLKFKLSTYLSRKKKGRMQVLKRWSLFRDKRPVVKYILDSYAKSLGAYILCKIGKESRFIARRNEDVKSKHSYKEILCGILSK